MSELAQILSELGLQQYMAAFEGNDIDDSLLGNLDGDDLKEIGISSLGHRKRILSAIEVLRQGTTPEGVEERAPGNYAIEPPQQAALEAAKAERREVTTVFADLTGFTKLSTELEAEDLHQVLSVFYGRFDEIVSRLGGTVERHIGDCVMAVFGAPVSYGNDAEHALRASLEMHRAMKELSTEFGQSLSVHIGVASGNVLFSAKGRGALKELDFSLTGDSVNLASRLADRAEPGETLITERVHVTLGADIDCDSPDTIEVKGFDETIPVLRFLNFAVRSRSQALIGRDDEIQEFQDISLDCLANGTGGVLAIVAEAGLGKTTLVEELERVAGLEGYSTHKSHFLDFGQSESQDPVRVLLRRLCSLTDAGSVPVASVIEELAGGLDEKATLFLTVLLGGELDEPSRRVFAAMSDEVRSTGMRRVIGYLVRSFASRQPLLLIVEDLHWASQDSLGQLAAIAAATLDSRALLLVTCRAGQECIDDDWCRLAGTPQLWRMELRALGIEESLRIAETLENPLSEELVKACVARAEGNPLFLEQLLRHASDQGGEEVPGSIQSIVQSKLDLLQLIDRLLLEGAAVMGQRFSLNDVQCITGVDRIDESPLVEADLIRNFKGGYLFAHALIRDAVLRTILRDELRSLHLRAATLFKGKDLVLYAEHLASAQDEGAALAYLDAARQATQRHRKETALSLAQRGLSQRPDASTAVDLQTLRGDMLRDLGRGEEAIEAFESILDSAESAKDRCRAQIGIVATMRIQDRIDAAFELLDEAELMASEARLAHELSEIHYFRGSLHFPRGDLEDCLNEHRKSLEFALQTDDPERQALALSGLGDAHYAEGKMFTAHGVIAKCLELCDQHHLLAVKSANRFMLATVKIYLTETESALEEARASSSLAATVGHSRAEIVSRLTTAWILASMAQCDAAEEETRQGLALAESLGARRFEPFLEETLADIALARGDAATADKIAGHALQKVREFKALSFIGPWVISTAARATEDSGRRTALLAEGEELLAAGCVGHNYFRFYKNAMDASIAAGDWDEVRRYAKCLQDFTRSEPTPWSDFYIERAMAVADAYGGAGSIERCSQLLARARKYHLHAATGELSRVIELQGKARRINQN